MYLSVLLLVKTAMGRCVTSSKMKDNEEELNDEDFKQNAFAIF